jgi:hypothetical protein
VKLSDDQLDALRNLSAKANGGVVGWISIAAARGLTDLGFADRTQCGWRITPAGAAALDLSPPPGNAVSSVVRDRFPNGARALELRVRYKLSRTRGLSPSSRPRLALEVAQ